MTATDERGVEHYDDTEEVTLLRWGEEVLTYTIPRDPSSIHVQRAEGQPRKVYAGKSELIAATLGDTDATGERHGVAGTCHNVEEYPFAWSFTCSECGVHSITEGRGFNFCPNCGREVVDE